MNSTICVRIYPAPPVCREEILRYAGVRGDIPELDGILDECLLEISSKLIYKVCYGEFALKGDGETLDLGFLRTCSADLKKNLSGCDRVVVFAATVGIELDRLIARYSRLSPVKALLLQAIGAERIEALCNVFSEETAAQAHDNGKFARPRFSPGYGDFALETQREFFAALDCARKIGLTLNESMLMSPTKSVTAIIGIGKTDCRIQTGCTACGRKDCIFGEHHEDN